MNVSGVGFPGTPGVILGQNERHHLGRDHQPDGRDRRLQRQALRRPAALRGRRRARLHRVAAGSVHPGARSSSAYLPREHARRRRCSTTWCSAPGCRPRRRSSPRCRSAASGPIIDIDEPGRARAPAASRPRWCSSTPASTPPRELQTFRNWNRAREPGRLPARVSTDFDVGSQNWAYADRDGNLAYFTSAELPLRTDLEQGARGRAAALLRARRLRAPNNWVPDPAHSQGQAIPFAVLPADEMPHTLNPVNGFFVNANNDPAGTSLDNDPLNQAAPVEPGRDLLPEPGLRRRPARRPHHAAGARTSIARPAKVSREDMKRFQANTQQLDAELMTPFLLDRVRERAGAGRAGGAGRARAATRRSPRRSGGSPPGTSRRRPAFREG